MAHAGGAKGEDAALILALEWKGATKHAAVALSKPGFSWSCITSGQVYASLTNQSPPWNTPNLPKQ